MAKRRKRSLRQTRQKLTETNDTGHDSQLNTGHSQLRHQKPIFRALLAAGKFHPGATGPNQQP